ncbi:MAG: hypothetical protein HY784_10175 [Chloroflexi bacterium]|nr:hypothetical protein [Chloroflexota bacterium]
MAPVVHGLEQQYSGRIGFIYLDIDDRRTERFKQQFGYVVQPEYVLLDGNGNVLQKWAGFVRAEDFIAAFEAALAGQP